MDPQNTSRSFSKVCIPLHVHKTNTAFDKKNITPTVNHGGSSVMVWGRVAASGPGRLVVTDGTMNSALYQKVLKETHQFLL